MTAERLAPGVESAEQEHTDPDQRGLPAPVILSICDRLLGEVGRRRHMFGWLRAPGAAADDWLPVDAYYPRARLVVICRFERGPHDTLFRELVPAHGLGLLTLDPHLLGGEEAAVEAALASKIFDLKYDPRAQAREATPVRRRDANATPAADAPAPTWTPVKVERMAVVPALEQGVGLLLGLALAGILIAEVYLAVVGAAFGSGRVMLGFAIALEACARALGTVAAARAGERVWACACAIGGAVIAAWFAFGRRSGRVEVEPAPLAGLLAGLAAIVALLALLVGS